MKLIKTMCGLMLVLTMIFQIAYAKDISVNDSILINDDFSADTLVNYWKAAGTVTYDADAEALKFETGRLIKNSSMGLYGGAYSLSATFNFSKVANVNVLLSTSHDKDGYLYSISVSDGKMKMSGYEICTVEKDTDYNVEVRFSLDEKLITIYVNGKRYFEDKKISVNQISAVNRFFDIDARSSSAVFTVDNIKFKKIIWDSRETATLIWNDDFETSKSGYISNKGLIVSLNGRNVYSILKGQRLLTNATVKDGEISISCDVTIPQTGNANGTMFKMMNKDSSKPAFTVELYGTNIHMIGISETGERQDFTICKVTPETFVNLKFDVNIDAKTVDAYVDGKLFKDSEGKQMYINELSEYNRYFDANATVDYYLDNLKVIKYTGNKFNYGEYYDYFDDDSSVIFNSPCENGVMTVAPGNGKQHILYGSEVQNSGVHSASMDIRFTNLASNGEIDNIVSAQSVADGVNTSVFDLIEKRGDVYVRSYIDSGETPVRFRILADADAKEEFNFKYTVNLDTKRIYFFVNGVQVLAEYELYMSKSAQDNLAVPADFNMNPDNRKNTFTIDNYKFYRDELGALLDCGGIHTADIMLPEIIGGSAVTYTTSDAEMVSTEGNVTPSETEKAVILTANADGYKLPITITVPGTKSNLSLCNANGVTRAYATDLKSGMIILAIYNGDGEMVDIAYSDTTSLVTSEYINSYNGEYTAKAMLWDGLENIRPLDNMIFNKLSIIDGEITAE